MAWRKILNDYRQTKVGQGESCIPKDTFPKLLCQLVNKLAGNGHKNITAGFRKSGIFPLDVTQLLGRLPSQESSLENSAAAVDRSLIKMLKNFEYSYLERFKKKLRNEQNDS